MTQSSDIAVLILMASSMVVLMLEAIGNRQVRFGLVEKPHIRLLTFGTLFISFLLVLLDVLGQPQISKLPLLFINKIASIFLIGNTIIAITLGRRTFIKSQSSEIYFLFLSSLALAIANILYSSLVLKMICSVGWLVLTTTLAIQSTKGGKKAEIGLKLTFTTIIVLLQFLLATLLLYYSHQPIDLDLITINGTSPNIMSLASLILLALAGLALAGIPPFHFGHVDCADGGNISVAFLLLSNSFIQSSVLLLDIKNIFVESTLDIKNETNFLGFILIFGFMVLWLRALDQSKIRRTVAYIATSVGPLFAMSLLFGVSVLLPKLVFLLAIYSFLTMTLFTLYGSLAYMDPINLPWQTWEDMSGFGKASPWLTLIFLVAVSTIAGLPGTLGYFIKLSLIAPLQESIVFSGSILLSIAIGAACAMRIFVFMFSKTSQVFSKMHSTRPPMTLLFASLILVALGFFPFVR